ncbi:Transposase IS200 like protein [Candidatus Methylomirabilis lanthanidiphila]|uniref:Transposase IS200 like protein n=1 Tax=Candidatus Methylomirabilis lanthanidiphila TaxID=2211376 RepID=A0A564ZG07_9BACT|nr:Transposase IS200 like protein [Candidatus Methylomirabilis lanthanidiphila]
MARIARVIASGYPHHITQRGNRRQQTFFCDDDYRAYISLMSEWCKKFNVEIWAYCLMPNHVHIIAVPESEEGLRRAIGEAHRRYTRHVNFREGWRGHLWQGRFSSFPMDENYHLAAARYIELNPVRAGLVEEPWSYPWSSAHAHLTGDDDRLVKVTPLLKIVQDWRGLLLPSISEKEMNELRTHERTGRPLGNERFVENLEGTLGRILRKQKPGRKKMQK